MKKRNVYSAPDLETAQAALAAARQAGMDENALSLIARPDIESRAIPDDRRQAGTDVIPAALRGALIGGAIGLAVGIAAVIVPRLGVTWVGAGAILLMGALVGAWSAAMFGSMVRDPVRRRFEKEIAQGRILLVIDAEVEQLHAVEAAVVGAGATALPFEKPTAVS